MSEALRETVDFGTETQRRQGRVGRFIGVDYGSPGSDRGMVCRVRVEPDGSRRFVDMGEWDYRHRRVNHDPHRQGGRRHWHAFDGDGDLGPPVPY